MKRIYKYTYQNRDGSGLLDSINNFAKDSHDVIAKNSNCLVLNDSRFTTVALESVRLGLMSINKPVINIDTDDSCSGNSIFFQLYSDIEYSNAEIKSVIKDKITGAIGFLSGLDLSNVDQALDKEVAQ